MSGSALLLLSFLLPVWGRPLSAWHQAAIPAPNLNRSPSGPVAITHNPTLNRSDGEAGATLSQQSEPMAAETLNPSHYPARRAAVVALHSLRSQRGSPFRSYQLDQVLCAARQEVDGVGTNYNVTFSVNQVPSNISAGQCTAEVLFLYGEGQTDPLYRPQPETEQGPQVRLSYEDLLNPDASVVEEEEAFYQRLRNADRLLSVSNIPDSYGHIDPDMNPLWYLGGIASSFVMLKESSQNTLYNLAQVANITQLETQEDQLRFQYDVLLHEMVSQEIVHWKLQVSWSPSGGVRVLQREWQPKCQECVTLANKLDAH